MALDLEAIRRKFVEQMEQWLELLPEDARNQPFMSVAGGEDLSPEQMVAEVRGGTEWGDRLLENAIALSASKQMQRAAAPSASSRRVVGQQSRVDRAIEDRWAAREPAVLDDDDR